MQIETEPTTEFLRTLLAGICRDRVILEMEGGTIWIEASPNDYGTIVGKGGNRLHAIRLVVWHAARLAKKPAPRIYLRTPDARGDSRPEMFTKDWDEDRMLEYAGTIITECIPGAPNGRIIRGEDGISATLVTEWPADLQDDLRDLPAALTDIFRAAGRLLGVRFALKVEWV